MKKIKRTVKKAEDQKRKKNKRIFLKPKKPNGFEENPTEPKKADNEDDNEDDNDIKKKKSKRKTFTPPTLEEIEKYVLEKKLQVDSKKFYDYFTEGNWIDSKGNHVKSWKQKILTWNGYSTPQKTEKKTYQRYDQRENLDLEKLYANRKE